MPQLQRRVPDSSEILRRVRETNEGGASMSGNRGAAFQGGHAGTRAGIPEKCPQECGHGRLESLLYKRSLAVIFFTTSIVSGAIDGTVTNRTTGKPQPGATITLYKITQNGPES